MSGPGSRIAAVRRRYGSSATRAAYSSDAPSAVAHRVDFRYSPFRSVGEQGAARRIWSHAKRTGTRYLLLSMQLRGTRSRSRGARLLRSQDAVLASVGRRDRSGIRASSIGGRLRPGVRTSATFPAGFPHGPIH